MLVSCGIISSLEPSALLGFWREPSEPDRMSCKVVPREVGCTQRGSAVGRWSGSFEAIAWAESTSRSIYQTLVSI